MKLKDFQDQFQRAILERDAAILELIPDGAHEGKAQLLSVYQDGYALRLIEVIRSDHKALATYLGDDAFAEMARAYIAAHPSRNPNARWVSRHVPEFLRANEPYAQDFVAGDVAQIEHALNSAFDATDAPVLTMADVAAVEPGAWASLTFQPHTSCRRFNIASNAYAIWKAIVAEDDIPDAARSHEPVKLFVWRQDGTSMIRDLGNEEAMMWDEAAKGVRFGVLCEMLATFDDPDGAAMRAASYLRGWLESGALYTAHVGRAIDCETI